MYRCSINYSVVDDDDDDDDSAFSSPFIGGGD